MNIIYLSVFLGFGVMYFILGLLASKKIENNEDYFLAGRKLGLFSVFFALVATQLGGGTLLGTAAQSYKVGYWGISYVLGISLGFILLGLGVASRLRGLNVATTAELFEVKYKSNNLRKIASILSVATMFGLLGGQVVALKSILASLGLNEPFVLIAFWLLLITYTVIGGLKAVTATDIVQILFVVSILGVVFLYSLLQEPLSFFSLKSLISWQEIFYTENFSFLAIFPATFNTMMFALIEQDLAQRCFAAKTKLIASLACMFAGLFMILFAFIPIYFGMKANIDNITILQGANPLFVILQNMTSNLLMVFIVCGFGAAVISTADSLLCAISSNIAQDFDFSVIGFKNKLKVSQGITFIVGMLALSIAYFSDDIISVLIQSYELSVSSLFIPIFFSYFKNDLKKSAALLAIIFGTASFIFFRIFPITFPKEIVSLLISLAGYLIGNYYANKKEI